MLDEITILLSFAFKNILPRIVVKLLGSVRSRTEIKKVINIKRFCFLHDTNVSKCSRDIFWRHFKV